MNITYRQGGVEDAAAVDRVYRTAFNDTFAHLYRPEDLEAFLAKFSLAAWKAELADDRYVFRLAEADGQPIGFAKIGPPELPVDSNEPWVELRQLYVLNEWRGAGAARELMDWVFAEAKERGAANLYLDRLHRQPSRPALLSEVRLRGDRPLRLHGRRAGRRGHHHAEGALSVDVIRSELLARMPHGFLGRRGGASEGEMWGLNVGYGSGDDPI